MRLPIIGLDLEEVSHLICSLHGASYNSRQLLTWLYRKKVRSIDEMTDLPKTLRLKLQEQHHTEILKPSHVASDKDGTKKLLFEHNELIYETALIPEEKRFTVCLSTQTGCRFGCRFCATGGMIFRGNLDAFHIIQQVYHGFLERDVTNIVFMGMGEPLDNLESVLKSIQILTAEWGFAFPSRKITVSTVGLQPALQKLIDQTKVNIAISLHSPFHEERKYLMPVENAHPIMEVLDSIQWRNWPRTRRLTFEYILLKDINDSYAHARTLAKLALRYRARVNLIQFNPVERHPELLSPSENRIVEFESWLRAKRVSVTLRKSRGQKIHAACGMLAAKIV
ncbi:MAG: 23S rRNA (adenine(2503)-C(2))-methyltransferase RlmN [Bacteroidales bacterium]|nr:23S rRNA (adenine(2503)-C(2))-methyltransferase RlmN [Bacteroidales bacterium]